jgi:hypothetical protein
MRHCALREGKFRAFLSAVIKYYSQKILPENIITLMKTMRVQKAGTHELFVDE